MLFLAEWFFGEWNGLLHTLIAFVLADYIVLCCCVIAKKKQGSKLGVNCIIRKCLIFLLVGLANIVDTQLTGECRLLRSATIIYFIGREGLTLLESASLLGLPIPPTLKEYLSQLLSFWKK